MTEYDNTNRFSLWGNKKKREGKQDADFTGNANIQCPHCGEHSSHWVKAWRRKEGANPNAAALAGKFEPKDGQRLGMSGYLRKEDKPHVNNNDMDDTIPF